jgi:hypothetical protein
MQWQFDRLARAGLVMVVMAFAGAPGAASAEGRVEINQATASAGGVTPGDAPGFPVEIFTTGSFVLTGDLAAPGNASAAIAVYAQGVRLDLNGFSISSVTQCPGTPPVCSPTGTGVGIDASGASDVSVRNGRVAGFGVYGLMLYEGGRADDLVVESNGLGGVVCEAQCAVNDSTVRRNGGPGIAAGVGSLVVRNVVASNAGSLDAANARFRRFYITKTPTNGAGARTACAPGYHMASLWEIHEPTLLQYETTLGAGAPDLGFGPPSDYLAWVRTGANTEDPEPGAKHCNGWTSASASASGTVVMLSDDWRSSNVATWPWLAQTELCSSPRPVWCVED